jgi:hypothetical protein
MEPRLLPNVENDTPKYHILAYPTWLKAFDIPVE